MPRAYKPEAVTPSYASAATGAESASGMNIADLLIADMAHNDRRSPGALLMRVFGAAAVARVRRTHRRRHAHLCTSECANVTALLALPPKRLKIRRKCAAL